MNTRMAFRRRQLPAGTICLLAALSLLVTGCRERSPTPPNGDTKVRDAVSASPAPVAAPGQSVQLVIDYGDGTQKRFTALPWRDGMTVLDVMQASQRHSHGIAIAVRGSGETALLTKLDDVANEEGAAGARNWIFYVNDHMADRSLGATPVKSGDTILWKFERYVE
jgi:hypothetical protein